eukprot:Rhum_TRINITY_DN15179_c0_g2::Rhum_TRINITY_DN15179_c0_g2_i1::g.138485::m.138485
MWTPILLLAASALALVPTAPNALPGAYKYEIFEGDIQRPVTRDGKVLGSTSIMDRSNLWSNGRFNYYIETKYTNADNPASYLLKWDDARIVGAIAHWEAKTCVRFTKCPAEAGCAKPYIRFISDKSRCNSMVGVSYTKVNQINLAEDCRGIGTSVHEIGHSAGLTHEQSRKDRDRYVNVVKDQIKDNHFNTDFAINDPGRDILPYNYDSIMHYNTGAFAIGKEKTIIAPQRVGQRVGLSQGDIDALHFMYNDCSETYAKPICVASVAAGKLIPHSKAFKVEFNGQYATAKTMTVKYDGTDAPAAMVKYDKTAGTDIGNTGFADVTYTPAASEGGKTRTLSVTFVGSDGAEATCSVTVKVADSENVCLGLPGSDPKVCSGKGTCTANVITPCDCDGNFGGIDCSGFADCPKDYFYTFDSGLEGWFAQENTVSDTTKKAQGAGSLKVGEAPSNQGAAHLGLPEYVKPKVIEYFFNMMPVENQPKMFFRGENSADCFGVRVINYGSDKVFYAASKYNKTAPRVKQDQFYALKLNIDWAARQYALSVDGEETLSGLPFDAACAKGMTNFAAFGYMWLDEFKLHCLEEPEEKDECAAM